MTAGYTPDERELLRAVRHLVRADRDMRRRLGDSMAVNLTDLRALRFVIRAAQEGEEAVEAGETGVLAGTTPRRLADHLGITTAATTTLVDRMVASGRLARSPHPVDRRSVLLVPTDQAREEMHAHLADMHQRMKEIAAAVPDEARPALVAFLASLTEEMEKGRVDIGG